CLLLKKPNLEMLTSMLLLFLLLN
ncbi:uncharacterized protein METZ01_LOCUS324253, partial [marine metagenome]